MFAAMASYVTHIPRVAGVELLLADGETLAANLVIVKRIRAKVHFVNGEYGLTTIGAIKHHVPDGVPVALTIGGKGIIHRTMAGGRQAADEDSLKQVLPNAKPEDFYVQKIQLEGALMLSVARRKPIDDILSQLEKQGLVLFSVALGPFAVNSFLDYLGHAGMESLTLGRHHFTLHQDAFTGYELLPGETSPTKKVAIADEQLNERLVPAFAAAFHVIGGIPFDQLPIPNVQVAAADYRQQLAFKRSGIVLMAFFLLLLLGNAGYFMHYSDKVASFAGSDARGIQREIDALRQQSLTRDALLDGLWHTDVPRWEMAYMADRIASSLPTGILLGELAIYPRDEALSRKQRRPIHTPSAIRIKGTSVDMPLLNGWVKQVRMLAFCETVEIAEYGYNDREGTGTFILHLELKP